MKLIRLLKAWIPIILFFFLFELSAVAKEKKVKTRETSLKTTPIPLTLLPRDRYKLVDWAAGVREGILEPLSSFPANEDSKGVEKEEEIIDLLVQIKSKKDFMPDVLFPHAMHTYWLSCEICHPKIFPMEKGGTVKMTMWNILGGEYCGRCHGRVAFPLRECYRCHMDKIKKNQPKD